VVSPVSTRSGLEQTKDRDPTSVVPLGQPQLNVPREWNHPGKPLWPRYPKKPHHRRAADDSLCGTRPQSSSVRHGTVSDCPGKG
jgi:hypothetical protein